MSKHGRIKLITGTTHPELAKRVAKELGVRLVKTDIGFFDDGELFARVNGNVRESDLFFIGSLHAHHGANSILETGLLLDCISNSAERITGMFTWIGYAKQDRAKPREALSFRVLAKIINTYGFDQIVFFDLHNLTSAGMFDVRNFHIYFMRLLIEEFNRRKLTNVVIGSPDEGSTKRARTIALLTNQSEICIVSKAHDPETKEVDFSKSLMSSNSKGISGKNIWIWDDMIQSGRTIMAAVRIIKQAGANKITVAAVHPDFTPGALELIADSPVDEVIVVDTIPHTNQAEWPSKITVIDPAPFIADCIKLIHTGGRLSPLFLQY
ncbi:ribose-phosphate diphosphokinase [Patescibacteria group bacterium]|nr:ribose-phosphate diphosphokinase [Patescibacteria group bacterium]